LNVGGEKRKTMKCVRTKFVEAQSEGLKGNIYDWRGGKSPPNQKKKTTVNGPQEVGTND